MQVLVFLHARGDSWSKKCLNTCTDLYSKADAMPKYYL